MIKKHIPNAITSLNLFFGASGILAVIEGQPQLAFILMLFGAIADFFDGFAARVLGAYSPMGKELDSQADQVTFGVLPAIMLYDMIADCGWMRFVPLLIAVFSGLRLAKFNIDERQTTSFIGLPTPANALLCGSTAYFVAMCPESPIAVAISNPWTVCIASVVLSLLLISEIPMFSLKFHKGDKIGGQRICLAVCAAAGVIAAIIMKLDWSITITATFIAYIFINTVWQRR